jgi:hypothetical protein
LVLEGLEAEDLLVVVAVEEGSAVAMMNISH